MKDVRSSAFYYYLLRAAAIAMGLMALLLLHAFLWPQSAIVDSGGQHVTAADLSVLVVIGVLIWFAFRRLAIVSFDNEGVSVQRGSTTNRIAWREVRSASKIWFTAPPVYRLAFDNGEPPAYFAMRMFVFFSVDVEDAPIGWDRSGIVKYARAQIEASRGVVNIDQATPPRPPASS